MKNIQTEENGITITYPIDCGNAPKKVVLRDFTIDFVKKDTEAILNTIADSFRWEIVGEEIIEGKENVLAFLESVANNEYENLHIKSVITHGKTASLNGSVTLTNETTYEFCHVYLFTSAAKHAKLKEMTSYIIHV